VPKSALVARGATTGVWLIADGKVTFRGVRTGPENQGQVEILEGLQGGEKLAADAAAAPLKDGARVKVKGN